MRDRQATLVPVCCLAHAQLLFIFLRLFASPISPAPTTSLLSSSPPSTTPSHSVRQFGHQQYRYHLEWPQCHRRCGVDDLVEFFALVLRCHCQTHLSLFDRHYQCRQRCHYGHYLGQCLCLLFSQRMSRHYVRFQWKPANARIVRTTHARVLRERTRMCDQSPSVRFDPLRSMVWNRCDQSRLTIVQFPLFRLSTAKFARSDPIPFAIVSHTGTEIDATGGGRCGDGGGGRRPRVLNGRGRYVAPYTNAVL